MHIAIKLELLQIMNVELIQKRDIVRVSTDIVGCTYTVPPGGDIVLQRPPYCASVRTLKEGSNSRATTLRDQEYCRTHGVHAAVR